MEARWELDGKALRRASMGNPIEHKLLQSRYATHSITFLLFRSRVNRTLRQYCQAWARLTRPFFQRISGVLLFFILLLHIPARTPRTGSGLGRTPRHRQWTGSTKRGSVPHTRTVLHQQNGRRCTLTDTLWNGGVATPLTGSQWTGRLLPCLAAQSEARPSATEPGPSGSTPSQHSPQEPVIPRRE